MSVDISRLAIEVTTSGIKEASAALGGLSRAAGTADKRVESLTDKLAKMMMAGGNATGVISGLTGSMALINTALQSAAANAAALAQSLGSTTQGMNSLSSATNQASGALREKAKWGGVVQTTLKAMATAALAYVGVNFLKHSVEAADGWQLMQAKLKIATGSLDNAKYAQNELFEMSQKLMVPMEGVTKLFTRMAPAMRNNNKTFQDTKDVVEGVALALKLNGATAGEVSSVMLQFSQSMQKGYLDGAEFNAVAENGSLLMQALSRETGKSTGELKKMGSQSKITRELLQQAIAHNLPQWREDFASLPVTVDGAMQRIKNSWIKAMGEMSADSGLNKQLVSALGVLQSLIPTVRDELTAAFVTVFKWVGDNRDTLWEIWTQVKGITKDVFDLVGALSAGVGAVVGMGDGFSIVGFALFSVRLAIAGVQDGLTLVGAILLKIGSSIIENVASPLVDMVLTPIHGIIDAFSGLLGLLARGADAAGFTGMAESLRSASDFGDNLAQTVKGMQDGFKGVGKAMADSSSAAYDMLANGNGAVAKLLAGEQQVTMEVQKRMALDKSAWSKITGPADKPPVDKEAEKAHNKAMREANTEMEKSLKLYTELAQTYELIQRYGLDHDKLTAGEKQLIEIDRALLIVKDKQARAVLEQARANAIASIEIEKVNKLSVDTLKNDEAEAKLQGSAIAAAEKQARALQDKINLYGKTAGAVEAVALAQAKATLQAMIEGGETDKSIERQRNLVAALETVRAKSEELSQLELGTKIEKELDALKPADFGNGFGDAFGSIGKAIDKAGKSLDQYNKKMTNLAKIRKDALNIKDDDKRNKALEQLQKEELRNTVDMYADMAGSVKSFFKEKTAAYKVFDAFEKGLRLAQMALVIEEMVTKVFASETATAAKAAETTAGVAMDATSAASSVSASLAKAAASTTAGVAKAFEQMGVWGFVGAAAILAFMAAVGFSGGSGTGAPNMTAEQRQKTQGTGTVLGDEEAKSESLTKAMDRLNDKYNMGLEYSSRMLAALRSIDSGISGMAASVVGMRGVRGTTADQYAAGVGSSKSALGFGSKSTEMTDSGIEFDPNQTLASIVANGASAKAYYDLHKESSSWWGLSKKSSNEHHTSDTDAAFKGQIGAVVGNMIDVTKAAAQGLGMSGDALTATLNNMTLGLDKVSLKGLSGEDLEKELNAAFSTLGDKMAKAVMDSTVLTSFQQVGEGSLETLVRLSSGIENAKMLLDGFGVSMINFNDIIDKHGEVDAELVRQSLVQKEVGSNVAQFITEMSGSAEDIIDAYKSLLDIRGTLKNSGLATDVTRGMIRGAGGLDQLSSNLNDFMSGFYTDAEQAQVALGKVRGEFAQFGLQMPTTKANFRSLIESLMHSGESGQEMAARLMGLSSAFTDAMDALEQAKTAATEDARSALSDAYDAESSALQDLKDKMDGFVKSLKDFKDALIMGDESPLNAMEKYATAKARYQDVYSKAMSGDADAIAAFQGTAQQLLELSREVNASGAGYTNDYQTVLTAIDQVSALAQDKSDTATTQLDALNQQVKSLIDINDSVKTVAQAIEDLNKALTMTGESESNGTSITSAISTGDAPLTTSQATAETTAAVAAQEAKQASDALLAEVQAMRAELAALRAEQAAQASAIVDSNHAGPDEAADKLIASKSVGSGIAGPLDFY